MVSVLDSTRPRADSVVRPARACRHCGDEFLAFKCNGRRADGVAFLTRAPRTACGRCFGTITTPERKLARERAGAWASRRVPCPDCGRSIRGGRAVGVAKLEVDRARVCRGCYARRRTIAGPTEARRMRNEAKRLGDRITTRAVYTRDGGTCALCGEAVLPDFGTSRATSPSVDHVVPLVRGGTHTWNNVRLAHVGCNARKGARL